MKKNIVLFLLLLIGVVSTSLAADTLTKYKILLTGASFAVSENGWFELGCERLNATPINRAIGGEAIASAANRMIEGTLYTREELEEIDAFVIMQVHDKDVMDSTQLRENYADYKTPFDRSNYAAAYDYVIKCYMDDCYKLRLDKNSKYYNTKTGKPVVIILCTHWNDARGIYNTTIRQLGAKWGFPVVEFDRYIGFSKAQNHPITGQPFSLLYANDTQVMEGIKHGFHPFRGKDQYIQQRMAAIFADLMGRVLL